MHATKCMACARWLSFTGTNLNGHCLICLLPRASAPCVGVSPQSVHAQGQTQNTSIPLEAHTYCPCLPTVLAFSSPLAAPYRSSASLSRMPSGRGRGIPRAQAAIR
ncbi:hypothetical protein GQ53DRAFT_17271 [Thozetella sp. PMI_491]|nr:hypothetical protein GQ53DRAFT_17271 [Thozetella sp. PMI_491]